MLGGGGTDGANVVILQAVVDPFTAPDNEGGSISTTDAGCLQQLVGKAIQGSDEMGAIIEDSEL